VSARLLTPPSYQAVQREDGSWYRAPRLAGMPLPYSQTWYQEYLRTHGLPRYFLQPRHLSMLQDNEEPMLLQRHNAPSSAFAVPAPHNYLELRHPEQALWPESALAPYRIEILSESRHASLARHFPAVEVTAFPYNTFVFPGGIIALSLPDEAYECPTFSENDVDWVELDQGTMVPSSYHQESTGLHPLSPANQSSDREALIQASVNNSVINPVEDIVGLGEESFLSDADRLEANRRGWATAHEVSMARRRGELAQGDGPNAGPITIFTSDAEYLNPVEQPQGQGAWRFLTSEGEMSNAGLASIQFGGSRGLPTQPSARQIRRLGQLFVQEGLTDLAAQINIVWVPGAEDDDDGADPTLDSEIDVPVEQEDPMELDQSQPTQTILGHTPAGLLIDPTNNNGIPGGQHDQTGKWAEYQTAVRHGGRTITIDRSRVWYNHPEPHKLEAYSAKGWRKWGRADTMDWKNKSKVTDLNKFRDQTHKRGGWPLLREVKREDYQMEELEFVMERVKAADGKRAKMEMEKLAADFHRRFPLRTESATGLQSLVDRLRKEYVDFGGLRPRKPRGWKQRQESHAARGGLGAKSSDHVESDDDGDDGEGDGGEGDDGEGDDGEGDDGDEPEENGGEDDAGDDQHTE
jgi:hypothetical protein